MIPREQILPLIEAAQAAVDAITFDDSGTQGRGGNGGLVSRQTIRKSDELRIAIRRAQAELSEMTTRHSISDTAVEAGAAAIANARASRRGVPPISNILVFLRTRPILRHLYEEAIDDARAAIAAADAVREGDAA